MGNQNLTATIGQLHLLESSLLSGDDSIEITISTRADGGAGFERKSFRTTLNNVLGIYAQRTDNPNNVTAAQVGSFTIEEVTSLLEEKLGVDGIAVNALKLEGMSKQEIVDEIRQGSVNNAVNLAGRSADEYLLTQQFESALSDLASQFDEMTDEILGN